MDIDSCFQLGPSHYQTDTYFMIPWSALSFGLACIGFWLDAT